MFSATQVGRLRFPAITVAIIAAAVYALSASWGLHLNVDSEAAALPAWSLAERGTLFLDGLSVENPWIREVNGRRVSNRPPGISLVAVPAYLLVSQDGYSNAPATATAVLLAAAAVGVLVRLVSRAQSIPAGVVAGLAFAFGTGMWPIASDQLWPHAPGALWLLLGLLGVQSSRYLPAGFAFGAAILTRPLTGVIPGILLAGLLMRRDRKAVIALAAPLVLSISILLFYNLFMYGDASLTGGYELDVGSRASASVRSHLANLAGMAFSPANGLFVWSPFLVPAVIAVARVEAPWWMRASGLGAAVYLLAHAVLNRYSGGLAFDYRYPIEALAASGPLLACAVAHVRRRSVLRRAVYVLLPASILAQSLPALFLHCRPAAEGEALCTINPWQAVGSGQPDLSVGVTSQLGPVPITVAKSPFA